MERQLFTFILLACLFCAKSVFAQNNVGVGTTNPSEKLEVSGIIYTNSGGIRFPDETLQETAAFSNFDPEDAGLPNGQVYMLIQTTSPPIPDTIRILDISQGGVLAPGSPQTIVFKMTKGIDATSHLLARKLLNQTTLTKVTMYFVDSEQQIYETIELRTSQLDRINFRSVYKGNGEYAHLEDLEFGFAQLEIKHDQNNGDCYCWDFLSQMPCTCD